MTDDATSAKVRLTDGLGAVTTARYCYSTPEEKTLHDHP